MRISVVFDGQDLSIDPDVAAVTVGDPVEWLCSTRGQAFPGPLVWTIYFNRRSPFGALVTRFPLTTLSPGYSRGGADHQGLAGPVYPSLPGDYKYGVSVQDAATQNVLGDDDPRLIVRP